MSQPPGVQPQGGISVLATTRRSDRLDDLERRGIDHPLLDTGEISDAVRKLYPQGVDAALELVGTPTLPDTPRSTTGPDFTSYRRS